MNVNWTNDLIFQLIDLYRERRLLWDHDIPDYKDKVKKHRTWQDIADVMGIPKEIVMRKMKTLTTQFQREHAKGRHLPAGEGSKWFAYTRMLFLGSNYTTAASRTSTSATATALAPAAAAAAAAPAVNTYEYYRVSPIDDCTIEVKEELDVSEGESSAGAPSRKRTAPLAPVAPPAPVASVAPRDEYSLYGEYVAVKLRKIRDAYTRHKAQQQINDVLFQAEMEDLPQQ